MGATIAGGAIAVVIGVLSAYFGGTVDYVTQRVVDTVQAIPALVLLIAILVVLGPSVTNVINEIEILPPSRFDDQIRRAEYRTVFSKADLGRYTLGAIPQVHIIVKNGHVTLEGVVMNQMDKNMAGIFANSVPGVFSVENNLRIG